MFEKIGAFVISKIHTFWYGIGYVGRVLSCSPYDFSHMESRAEKYLSCQLFFTYIEALPIVIFFGAGRLVPLYTLWDILSCST